MSLITVNLDVKGFKNRNRFYFIKKTKLLIETIDVTCSHRGGPLIYGKVLKSSPRNIICPWHGIHTSRKRLCKITVPTIKAEDKILIILKKLNFKILNYEITEL